MQVYYFKHKSGDFRKTLTPPFFSLTTLHSIFSGFYSLTDFNAEISDSRKNLSCHFSFFQLLPISRRLFSFSWQNLCWGKVNIKETSGVYQPAGFPNNVSIVSLWVTLTVHPPLLFREKEWANISLNQTVKFILLQGVWGFSTRYTAIMCEALCEREDMYLVHVLVLHRALHKPTTKGNLFSHSRVLKFRRLNVTAFGSFSGTQHTHFNTIISFSSTAFS